MAKGAVSKEKVFEEVMKVFPGSFLYNGGKELRINMQEDGELVQIKMVLTAAKVPVYNGEDEAIPGVEVKSEDKPVLTSPVETVNEPVEPTMEEKVNIKNLMETLGL